MSTPRSTRSTRRPTSALSKGVRVMSFNVKGEVEDLADRTKLLLDALKRADADIMCLQELISPPQRAVLTHFDHHVCYSGLSHPGNGVGCPWYANIPAVLVASIAGSLWHYQVVHVAVVAALLVVAALISAALLPYTLALIGNAVVLPNPDGLAKPGVKLGFSRVWFDWMASCIAVRKSMFHSLELVEASPFPVEIRGYLKPSSILNLLDWRVWWFGTSFLRPGMTIARCVSLADEKTTELLIVNVHLVTGVQNPVRTKQLAFVQNRIIAAMEKFGCTEVLLCGDFNGHHDQPELNQLRAAGWVDAVAYVHQHSQNKFLTWVNNVNPLVPPGEPDQRLDYIWMTQTLQATSAELEFNEAPFVSDHYATCADIRLRQ